MGLGQLTVKPSQQIALPSRVARRQKLGNPNPLQPVRAQIPGENVRLDPPSVALFILRLDRHPSLYDDRMSWTHLIIAKNVPVYVALASYSFLRRKKRKSQE